MTVLLFMNFTMLNPHHTCCWLHGFKNSLSHENGMSCSTALSIDHILCTCTDVGSFEFIEIIIDLTQAWTDSKENHVGKSYLVKK